MSINADIALNPNESTQSLLRRFTRRMQETGVLASVRGNKNHKRKDSDYIKKRRALAAIERRTEYERLLKLGKVREHERGARRRP
jgi:ribosomal protein S21